VLNSAKPMANNIILNIINFLAPYLDIATATTGAGMAEKIIKIARAIETSPLVQPMSAAIGFKNIPNA